MRSSSSTPKKPSAAITVHLTIRMPQSLARIARADIHREAQQPGHQQQQDERSSGKISILDELPYQAGASCSAGKPRRIVDGDDVVGLGSTSAWRRFCSAHAPDLKGAAGGQHRAAGPSPCRRSHRGSVLENFVRRSAASSALSTWTRRPRSRYHAAAQAQAACVHHVETSLLKPKVQGPARSRQLL